MQEQPKPRRTFTDRLFRRSQAPVIGAEETAQPTAGEIRVDRRHSNAPFIVTGLAAAALAGGIIFHDDLGRFKDNLGQANDNAGAFISGLGKDGSKVATPTASAAVGSPTPSASEKSKPTPSAKAETSSSSITAASKDASGNWLVSNPDGKEQNIPQVTGFTPDKSLVVAPEWGKALPLNPTQFADFDKSLNDPKNPLVGYSYGENDQSDNLDYRRTLQGPLYSWTVMTGQEVTVPGIGELKGGPGMAVEVMVMNISDHVIDWGSKNPVKILHGFTGAGRIWDGNNVVKAEQGVSSHYVNRLEQGVTLPGESGFIGQCDLPGNCNKVLVVSVIRRQWGNNQDGTPRFQFQLLREEIVSK